MLQVSVAMMSYREFWLVKELPESENLELDGVLEAI